MLAPHKIEDCPHNPTFDAFGKTLDRLEGHAARQADAMEDIAKNTVIIETHEKRLDKHDQDFREVFGRVRILENEKAEKCDVDFLRQKVTANEIKHAAENGAKKVQDRNKRFWDAIRVELSSKAVFFILMTMWVIDKYNILQLLLSWFKEFKG